MSHLPVRTAPRLAALGAVLFLWSGCSRETPAPAPPPAPPVRSAAQTPGSHILQAEAHFAARRYDDAAAAYRRALELAPGDASLYNELGLNLHYAGKSEAALDALRQATTADPTLQRAWLSYGFVLKSLGREAQARLALEKTVALGPGTPQGLEAQGMLRR